jgi:hypothetical protein
MNKSSTDKEEMNLKSIKTHQSVPWIAHGEMSLPELRQMRNVSQEYLAASMNKKQPNLSTMERSSDMYVSTLCKFIQAMGGNLEIVAHFPDGVVRINQFEKLKR